MFGKSSSSFDDVVKFYGHWESYSTKKSYSWLFTHDVNEIRDRRVLKLIDKEHKKIQQKARKERNDEVRSLVLFVKKRDKRMAEYRKMLEEKAAHNRLKSQQNRLDQIRKRTDEIREQQRNSKVHKDQQDHLKKLEEEYLNQFSDDEYTDEEDDQDLDDVEDIENEIENCQLNSDEFEEELNEELYCVACNKSFKNLGAKSNHDASKKHKQNIEKLKKEMNSEEESYQKAVNECKDEEISADESEEAATTSKPKGKKSKKKKAKKFQGFEEPVKSESEHDDVKDETVQEESIELLNKNDSEDDDWSSNKKGKKVKSKGKKDKVEKKETTKEVKELVESPPSELKYDPIEPREDIHRCATCKQIFQSKNKLFTHLKSTGHSVHLGEVKHKAAEKVGPKKKK